jgi:hypothetical protein
MIRLNIKDKDGNIYIFDTGNETLGKLTEIPGFLKLDNDEYIIMRRALEQQQFNERKLLLSLYSYQLKEDFEVINDFITSNWNDLAEIARSKEIQILRDELSFEEEENFSFSFEYTDDEPVYGAGKMSIGINSNTGVHYVEFGEHDVWTPKFGMENMDESFVLTILICLQQMLK